MKELKDQNIILNIQKMVKDNIQQKMIIINMKEMKVKNNVDSKYIEENA